MSFENKNKSNVNPNADVHVADTTMPSDYKAEERMRNFGRESSMGVERIKNSTLGFVDGEDASKEELFEELKRRILSYHPSGNLQLIEKAYQVADAAHKTKKRKSGQPYITHPLHVALILADLRMDKETIASALLHDVIEDCQGYDYAYICKEFGEEIADIVDGVTKVQKDGEAGRALSTLSRENRIQQHAETYRKMLLSSGKNPRVLYVKLADRLHNMRTLEHMSPEKQSAIALETINIYSPFAEKLGISKIKVELDDYSLKYLKPDMYNFIKENVNQRLEERIDYINQIIDRIKTILKENGIEASVTGRVKHFYSIYKKLINKKKEFDEIYDLFAVRVITKTVYETYSAAGMILQEYTAVKNRNKNYISNPKPNGYRSWHETLYGPDKRFFELQVRTEEMDRVANYGKAAHWVYKERGDGVVAKEDEIAKKIWLERLTEAVMEENDNTAFLERTQEILDMEQDKVIFKSALNMLAWELPAGSTVLDFAYAIHTEVGHKTIGAKVFNRMVSLDYVIKPFDVVEILTAKDESLAAPKRDWLRFVYLNSTKSKIKAWFNKQNQEENIQRGLELILKQCHDEKEEPEILENPKYQEKAMKKLYCDSWEKVLANIGTGSITSGKVLNWLKDARKAIDPHYFETNEELMERINSQGQQKMNEHRKNTKSITIQNLDFECLRFPQCCCAIPGDEVVGYITRGRGMSIHRKGCENLVPLMKEDGERLQEFVLPDLKEYRQTFGAMLRVTGQNWVGFLVKVLEPVANLKINSSDLNAIQIQNNEIAKVTFKVYVKDRCELEKVMNAIREVKRVYSVERIGGEGESVA